MNAIIKPENLMPVSPEPLKELEEQRPSKQSETQTSEYPLEHLPPIVRDAIVEANHTVQAPLALTAMSALSAVSVSVQSYIDVCRDSKLKSPTSLYSLCLAESGERKSSVDKLFTAGIREFENKASLRYKSESEAYKSELSSHEMKIDGLRALIRKLMNTGGSIDAADRSLRKLVASSPKKPREPKIIYADITPEALLYSLIHNHPSAAIMSAEGGTVFGGHGMKGDAIVRNLAALNQLWEYADFKVDRRGSDSFRVTGVRFGLSVQIQPATMFRFLDENMKTARGTGFFARTLLAWPETTRGERFYREPTDTKDLLRFNTRIVEILENPLSYDSFGHLSPDLMGLSPEAKRLWVSFYNAVEKESRGGRYESIHDFASKAAENCARIAACLQYFDEGPGRLISTGYLSAAVEIVTWHLEQTVHFIENRAQAREVRDEETLYKWLITYTKNTKSSSITRRELQRKGPLRDKIDLRNALTELEESERINIKMRGRSKVIEIETESLSLARGLTR